MKKFFALITIFVALFVVVGCDIQSSEPKSASGVSKTNVQVQTQASGMTIEQENIAGRIKEDNKPGSIKHLYVISAYSGQVIIYSTVKGKVTSSGKRINPYEVIGSSGGVSDYFNINIGGQSHQTKEVLQDDGTYGHSEPYIYWWDTKGVYHQHYVSGGQIIHVSNQPLAVKGIIINMEVTQKPNE